MATYQSDISIRQLGELLVTKALAGQHSSKYPFYVMAVGESFITTGNRATIAKTAMRAGHLSDRTFSTKTQRDGTILVRRVT